MNNLREIIGNRPGGKILDMATGAGEFIPYLQIMFPRIENIIGVDLSTAKISKAGHLYKNAKRTKFAVMDGERLGIKTGSFDTASITNSLHHLKNVDGTLQEMKRILKPGGMLLIFEMFRDNQSERQISHALAHHWWAEIDRLTGYLHNETFSRQEIIDIAERIALQNVGFIELDDPEPVDEEAMKRIRFTIDNYMEKLRKMGDREPLLDRGRELRQRIDTVGFAWAKQLCIRGYK